MISKKNYHLIMIHFQASNLSKCFDEKTIFGNISFEIRSSDILFVSGKNGSGKTTLLKILSGFMKPDTGDVKINGKSIFSDYKHHIVFVGHEPGIYKDLTTYENLYLWGKLWGKTLTKDDVVKLLRIFSIESYIDESVRKLSQGTQKKIALTKIFIAEPDVIVLDEPFSNLDDQGQYTLKEYIESFVKYGKIFIFSSPTECGIPFSFQIKLDSVMRL